MGRKLDLSGLTDTEAEHVLQVVQRDMRLRKKEEERLSELKQELDEEGSRCLLLSRQSCFNRRCCIRCCSPFIFLLNPRRRCRDCCYNVCKACRVYSKQDKAWICSACQKSRLLQIQSLEWFYTNVKRRFKRFGSAKVLKTLFKKHLVEHSTLSELTEGSAYEESVGNEGSVCGSDSAFYRQTEEHSMAEMLTVALRVAEEAIDEAISKAKFNSTSQNEEHYLQEHRGELIEELAKTIVQKIICRRKTLAEMKAEYDQNRPLRSHSAFSLLDNDPPGLIHGSPQALKKEGVGSAMSTWKSVDRLDNAVVSPVLKSPDGNWIALQSAQRSRPGLLTKRKSLAYSALERESGAVSAYEGLSSDDETKPEPDGSWGAVLQEIHRKMTDCNFNPQDGLTSLMDRRGSRDTDSEGNWKPNKPMLALLNRKVPAEIRRPSSSRRTSIIDVNFNVEGAGEEEEREQEVDKVRRPRRKRRSKNESEASSVQDFCGEHASDAVTPDTLTSGATTPEPSGQESRFKGPRTNQMEKDLTLKLQQLAGRVSDLSTGEEEVDGVRESGSDEQMEVKRQGNEDREEGNERVSGRDIDLDDKISDKEDEVTEIDEEMKCRLYKLVAQSRLSYISSADDDLDKVGQSEEEWEGANDEDVKKKREQKEEKTDTLTHKLCQLEKEVGANQFSSTEDELDRVGITDEGMTGEDGENGKKVELALKVCRLANQVNATQFSSTEDELDRAGRCEEGEEATDEESLWKLQAEKAVQEAQLRDLSSFVSASQFSPIEHEQDGGDEGGTACILWDEASGKSQERRESLGDLDVKMFDLRGEIEERQSGSSDEKETTEDVLGGEIKDDQQEKTEAEERKNMTEERGTGEDERVIKGRECEEKVLIEAENAKETERQEMAAEIMTSQETNVRQENQPEAKWSDENEREERQEEEKIRESKRSQEEWENPADSDDDDDDAEFDRIISSMLMMTLEDMQGDALNKAADSERINTESQEVETDENAKILRESGAEISNASEETGSAKDAQSRGNHENVPEQVRDVPSKNQSEELVKQTVLAFKETPEAAHTHVQIELDEEQVERGGKETDGETAGGCESKDAGGRRGEAAGDMQQSSASSPLQCLQSAEETQIRNSAVSLRSITTEVLKVLNATEDLLQRADGGDEPRLSTSSLPPNTDPKKLDQQFSRLEENVYVAAGAVYSLEAELCDLEECARGVCSATSDMELSFLEAQVASAAAKVQQTELQTCDISARIAALRSAGLDVDTQSRITKTRNSPFMPATLDSSRQLRRRLPAPPLREDKDT